MPLGMCPPWGPQLEAPFVLKSLSLQNTPAKVIKKKKMLASSSPTRPSLRAAFQK